jgi:molybdate transport system permease protein
MRPGIHQRAMQTRAPRAAGARSAPATARSIELPRPRGTWLLIVPAVLFLLFIAVPLVALVVRAAQSGELWTSMRQPIIRDALRISLTTSLATVGLVILFGTPLAYLLARYQFPGRQVVETLIDLPMVLPPVVAGVALLMAFGRRGIFGDALNGTGINIAFTARAVVLAQIFVSSPFYIRAVRVGFQGMDPSVEEAAAVDGAGGLRSFLSVTLPLIMPAFVSGLVLCWARAMSEFGATMMFAGNLPGSTQTASLAIMTAMQSSLFTALAMGVILLVVSFTVILVFRALARDGQSL